MEIYKKRNNGVEDSDVSRIGRIWKVRRGIMVKPNLKTWQITGCIFVVLYITLTLFALLYEANYKTDPTEWDFNGLVPLILTNFPGLIFFLLSFHIFGITVANGVTLVISYIVIVSVNLIVYFWVGASIGYVFNEVIKRTISKRKAGVNNGI